MTKDHNQAISNQTIPIQDILGQFLGLFDQFFGQKYQKVAGFDLRTHIPWTNWLSWVEKYWSHPLANSKNIILVQQTCDWTHKQTLCISWAPDRAKIRCCPTRIPVSLSPRAPLSSLSCHCVRLLIWQILLFLSKEVWQRWWSTFFNVPTVTLRCVCLI